MQDVRGDHVRQRPARTLKSRFESQSVCGEHGAHVAENKQEPNQEKKEVKETSGAAAAARRAIEKKEEGAKVERGVESRSCSSVRPAPNCLCVKAAVPGGEGLFI